MSPFTIGLTGGIATGKSTVARLLAERGVAVADADLLAREAVVPGSEILARIVGRYGSALLTDEGNLDRRALARIVFASADERRWLEAEIHPFVRAGLVTFRRRQAAESACLCLVVPLLFEAGMTDLVDVIWVVACPPELQRRRLAERDGLGEAEIDARLASQWPLVEKIRRATVVIENDADLHTLTARVEAALARCPCPS